MKPVDVIVVGELNVDLILNQISKFPEIGKEVIANNMTITLGSSSAIFASNLSSLGTRVAFLGKLGTDNFADHIIASLKAKNVDTSHIVHSTEHATGATIVLNFQEDRANVTYPGAMNFLTLADVTNEALQNARHLHVSSIFLQEGLRKDVGRLFKRAKAAGLSTSIDPQWDPSENWDVNLQELLGAVDIFMPNAAELQALTKTSDLQTALKSIHGFNSVIVIKNGNDGAYLWDGKVLVHHPAFSNKKVVDSIGAGDSFNAGFIHRYLQKKSWKECLEFGALTGAINTTRSGGTAAFETPELIKTIAQSTFNYTL